MVLPLWMLVCLLILGLLCLAIEMFIPGFGFFGFSGIILISLSIYFFTYSYIFTIAAVFGFIVIIYIFVNYILRNKLSKSDKNTLFLKTKIESKTTTATDKEKLENLIGKQALVSSFLRPSGKVTIDDKVYDAITEGEFIEKGKTVTVTAVKGNSLTVK